MTNKYNKHEGGELGVFCLVREGNEGQCDEDRNGSGVRTLKQ